MLKSEHAYLYSGWVILEVRPSSHSNLQSATLRVGQQDFSIFGQLVREFSLLVLVVVPFSHLLMDAMQEFLLVRDISQVGLRLFELVVFVREKSGAAVADHGGEHKLAWVLGDH